jgi:hypothetical protein
MISRRSFLIGLGSIVTSSFVVRARTHARIACAPLLAPDASEHTLFAEVFEPEGSSDGNKWRVSLGAPWQDDPTAPTSPTGATMSTARRTWSGSSGRRMSRPNAANWPKSRYNSSYRSTTSIAVE